MNKEVICKYRDCFDYWLDGGKVWTKYCGIYPDGNGWQLNDRQFNSEDYKYIQDDEYAEFRKAQADGKTIEYRSGSTYDWHIMEDDKFQERANTWRATEYRIKPDEPKYKVGDWVTFEDIITQVQPNSNLAENIGDNSKWKLWKPQVGEWCWFWDKGMKYRILDKYSKTKMYPNVGINTKRTKYWTKHTNEWFHHCEPYIGTLPTELEK